MFRFTIRDVLWLMVVVALCVGYWLANRDRENALKKSAAQSMKTGALENRIQALENAAKSQKKERDSIVIALAEELEKSLGRKLNGWSSVPDP